MSIFDGRIIPLFDRYEQVDIVGNASFFPQTFSLFPRFLDRRFPTATPFPLSPTRSDPFATFPRSLSVPSCVFLGILYCDVFQMDNLATERPYFVSLTCACAKFTRFLAIERMRKKERERERDKERKIALTSITRPK